MGRGRRAGPSGRRDDDEARLRRDGVARFLEAAAAHFTVEELREDAFHPDYYHHDLQVLVLTPR